MRKNIVIILAFMIPAGISGQVDSVKQENDSTAGRVYLLQQVRRNGEVLPEVNIKEVTIVGKGKTTRKSWYRNYDRLVYNLKRVYPYAIIVRTKIWEVNNVLAGMNNDKERKKYLKEFEKDVFRDYERDIKELSITQGKLLIKLIDRETQNTSFDLIHEYRGGLTAAFWQGVARIFGTNLKEEYDPYGSDIVIELILQDIETGRL